MNGARIFLDNYNIPPDKKVGAVGEKTAEFLIRKGVSVDFTGEGTDTSKIGKSFKGVANNTIVLVPCSDKSKGNIQKAISKFSEVREVHIYSTDHAPTEIPACNIYVFTSPMNVESFLKLNDLPDGTVTWAIGTSTGKALTQAGIEMQIAPKPSVDSIIDLLIR